MEFFSRIIFVNASTLNTNLILLNSVSGRFPQGLGNDNGLLGKYVAFHNYRAGLSGTLEGFEDRYMFGRNPSEPIIANYRNLGPQEMDYVGGFTTFSGGYRLNWGGPHLNDLCGAELKSAAQKPGPWGLYMYMQGETVPKERNQVRLSTNLKDPFGIPQLVVSVDYDDNDDRMVKDFLEQGMEMLTRAGCKDINSSDNHQPPGLDIHEMGGCRMGKDPKQSILNEWNQLHSCPNVFVTDGACMTSTGNQSPSILYMALTARAADHAVRLSRRGER